MTETIVVQERGRHIAFTFDDVMRYHGVHSPAGVAVAFKAMQRAFAVLAPGEPPARREVMVRTAFRGPGARDCFEAVTRAVSDHRYTVDRAMVRAGRGRLLEDFVFEMTICERSVTVLLRDGFVTAEFIDLARTEKRTGEEEKRLDELKLRLARHVIETPADGVFDVE